MKIAFHLIVASLLATPLLFIPYPQGNPDYWADGIAATYPEVPENETTPGVLSGNEKGQTTADYPNQYLLPLESSGYHLEFDAEKGITLAGATVADLLNPTPCLTSDFPALAELTYNYRIQVFINEQPTAIRATHIMAALRQIPAEKIKAIDIRTSLSDNGNPAEEADIIIQVTKIK